MEEKCWSPFLLWLYLSWSSIVIWSHELLEEDCPCIHRKPIIIMYPVLVLGQLQCGWDSFWVRTLCHFSKNCSPKILKKLAGILNIFLVTYLDSLRFVIMTEHCLLKVQLQVLSKGAFPLFDVFLTTLLQPTTEKENIKAQLLKAIWSRLNTTLRSDQVYDLCHLKIVIWKWTPCRLREFTIRSPQHYFNLYNFASSSTMYLM